MCLMGSVTPQSQSACKHLPLSAALALAAGFSELRHVAVTGSTNDDLAAEARLGDRSQVVLVADHQTAGRGRLGRLWEDAAAGPKGSEAALLVSFKLKTPPSGAYGCVAAVSAAALAAVSGIIKDSRSAESDSAAAVRSKWPNDLLIRSLDLNGKLAGVLSEIVAGEPQVVVVGLGMNLTAAPEQPTAVALAELGVACSRDEVLARLLQELPTYLTNPQKARRDLLAVSATIGSQVKVFQVDGSTVVGTAVDIDDLGRLVLETRSEQASGQVPRTVLIDSGDVFHLRS